jgi:hypothetical protein
MDSFGFEVNQAQASNFEGAIARGDLESLARMRPTPEELRDFDVEAEKLTGQIAKEGGGGSANIEKFRLEVRLQNLRNRDPHQVLRKVVAAEAEVRAQQERKRKEAEQQRDAAAALQRQQSSAEASILPVASPSSSPSAASSVAMASPDGLLFGVPPPIMPSDSDEPDSELEYRGRRSSLRTTTDSHFLNGPSVGQTKSSTNAAGARMLGSSRDSGGGAEVRLELTSLAQARAAVDSWDLRLTASTSGAPLMHSAAESSGATTTSTSSILPAGDNEMKNESGGGGTSDDATEAAPDQPPAYLGMDEDDDDSSDSEFQINLADD